MNDMVIPDTYCGVDSESGATELIPFLIWQYYPKWFRKAGGEKVKVVQFGWFNLNHPNWTTLTFSPPLKPFWVVLPN